MSPDERHAHLMMGMNSAIISGVAGISLDAEEVRLLLRHSIEEGETLVCYRSALRSIADNTCCDGCGEAARVATAALRERE